MRILPLCVQSSAQKQQAVRTQLTAKCPKSFNLKKKKRIHYNMGRMMNFDKKKKKKKRQGTLKQVTGRRF